MMRGIAFRIISAVAVIAAMLFTGPVSGQTTDIREQLHREAYVATVKGDQIRDEGNLAGAVEMFAVALSNYRRLARDYPGWRQNIVEARIDYCVSEIEDLLKRGDLDRRFRPKLAPLLEGSAAPVAEAGPPVVTEEDMTYLDEKDGVPQDDDLKSILSKPSEKKKSAKKTEKARPAVADDASVEDLRRELNRKESELKKSKGEYEDLREDYDKLSRTRSDAKVPVGTAREKELERENAALREEIVEVSKRKDEQASRAKSSGGKESDAAIREVGLLKEIERLRADIRRKEALKPASGPAAAPAPAQENPAYRNLQSDREKLARENELLRRQLAEASKAPAPQPAASASSPEPSAPAQSAGAEEDPAQLLKAGKLEAAHAAIEKGLAAKPEDRNLLYLKGTVLCKEGNYTAAAEVLQKVVTLDQSDADARVALGGTYLAMGDYVNARMELEMAVGFNPDLAEAHYDLALVLLAASPPDRQAAKSHYDDALRLGAKPDSDLEQRLKQTSGGSGQGKTSGFVPSN